MLRQTVQNHFLDCSLNLVFAGSQHIVYRVAADDGADAALADEQLPLAQARADAIIKDAEAKKTERINEATAPRMARGFVEAYSALTGSL